MKEYSTTGGEALPEVDEADYAPGATSLPLALTPVGMLETDEGDAFTRMPLRMLVPSLSNRQGFNHEDLKTMAETIKAWGVRHPLIVRPLPGARLQDTRLNTPKGQPLPTHEIVCGERRWRAATLADVATVPVIVRHLTDAQALEEQVTENVQREAYTALEEGEAYQRLMTHNHLTADEVAHKMGKSRRHIFNRTKLLDLRSETRESLLKGEIDPTRALLLARIPDHEQQILALARVVAKDYQGEFQMSLRDAEKFVQREFMLSLSNTPFKIDDITLLPDAGSCKDCTKRTGHNPDLFADVKSADICTDAPCFRRKEEAHNSRTLQQAHDNGQTVIMGREAKSLMPNSWGAVEGYLRLDNATDSPNKTPLRQILAKQLEMGEIKPTLIANPHQDGELIAVLPTATVAELLKAQGHQDEASTIDSNLKGDAKALANKEKEALKDAFERGWRIELMKRTHAEVVARDSGGGTGLSLEVQRHIARHYANLCNTDAAKQLCKLLDLGTVAPRQAVLDHIAEHPQPEHLILLMVMERDSHYRPWMTNAAEQNTGLLLVAGDLGVDIEAAKADIKQAIKCKMRAKSAPADAAFPVLRTKGGAGENRKPGAGAPAAPRKQKISADEATLGIAVAMQQMGSGQSDAAGVCPQDEHADAAQAPQAKATALAVAAGTDPVQGMLAVGVIGIGSRVKVLNNVSIRYTKWIGSTGTVTKKMGDRAWDVTFRDRNGGLASFDVTKLEWVAA